MKGTLLPNFLHLIGVQEQQKKRDKTKNHSRRESRACASKISFVEWRRRPLNTTTVNFFNLKADKWNAKYDLKDEYTP